MDAHMLVMTHHLLELKDTCGQTLVKVTRLEGIVEDHEKRLRSQERFRNGEDP